ncbi:MAG TPA: hypothetical protein GX728_04195 [Clostridiaceae bacterium]|nr:hypothetical protein [Clostridiaceae bacterium]
MEKQLIEMEAIRYDLDEVINKSKMLTSEPLNQSRNGMKIKFSVLDSRNSLTIDDVCFEDVSVFGFEFQGDTVKLKLEKEEPLNQILRELEKTNGILYALLLVHGIDVGSVLDQEPTGIRELARYALRQKNLAKGIDWPHLQSEEALDGKTLPTLKGLAACLEELEMQEELNHQELQSQKPVSDPE